MGPQLVGCGKLKSRIYSGPGTPRFNGAAARWLRKDCKPSEVRGNSPPLQWGRSSLAAESPLVMLL